MPSDYWGQPAELHRKISREDRPDAPLLKDGGKVAAGSLGEMIDQWGELPSADRSHHIMMIGGGALNVSILQAMYDRPRASDG